MGVKNGKNKECEMCGKDFYVAKWQNKKGRKYCSSICQNKAKIGKKQTEETKEKMSISHKGKIFSDKHKKNLSISRKGIKLSSETKKKLRKANLGERSPAWKGGISNNKYPEDWNNELREEIRKRDNYVCQECGTHQDELKSFNKKLDIHHIDYDKDNCDPKNLITLCRNCHLKTNFNRNYWKKYFNN